MSHDKSTYSVVIKGVRGQLQSQSASGTKFNLFKQLLTKCQMLTVSHVRFWRRDELIMTAG